MTATPATLHAYLGYADAPAAIEFLTSALGFELVRRWPEVGDQVAHAELRRGDAAFTLFSDTEGYERAPRMGDTCGVGLYLALAQGRRRRDVCSGGRRRRRERLGGRAQ